MGRVVADKKASTRSVTKSIMLLGHFMHKFPKTNELLVTLGAVPIFVGMMNDESLDLREKALDTLASLASTPKGVANLKAIKAPEKLQKRLKVLRALTDAEEKE